MKVPKILGSGSLNAFRKLILHDTSIISLEHLWQNQQVNPNHQTSSQLRGNWWHPGLSGTRLFLIKHSKALQLPKEENEEGGIFPPNGRGM